MRFSIPSIDAFKGDGAKSVALRVFGDLTLFVLLGFLVWLSNQGGKAMGDPSNVRSSSVLNTEASADRRQPPTTSEYGGLLDADRPGDLVEADSERRDELLSQLVVKTRLLAQNSIAKVHGDLWSNTEDGEICRECCFATHKGVLNHSSGCLAGSVLRLVDELANSTLSRKEVAQKGVLARAEAGTPSRGEFGEPWRVVKWPLAAEVRAYDRGDEGRLAGSLLDDGEDALTLKRIALCVNFCDGISNETLQAQKPLTDPTRPIHEQIAIGRAIGFEAVTR